MSLLVHHAGLLDTDGMRADGWVFAADHEITAVGVGAGWRQLFAEPGEGAREPVQVVDAQDHRVVPGFVDLHAHGGGGHRFEDPTGDLDAALRAHRLRGTTRTLLSLTAGGPDELSRSLAHVADRVESDPLVLGVHLEGPYLAPSRCGAHAVGDLREPDLAELHRLLDAGRGTVRQMTIAPELPGALDAIGHLVDHGVVAAVGHTEAGYLQARAAFDRGASLLTHAYNAMPGIGHREPGPVVAAVEDGRVSLELINDGHHVHPGVVAMTLAAAPGRVALVSDAMAAAGAGDGTYLLGSREVTVSAGVARISGTPTLAGSSSTLGDALRRAVEIGVPPQRAVAAVTAVPAAVLGMGDRFGRLARGHAADLVILDHDWRVSRVFAAGRELLG